MKRIDRSILSRAPRASLARLAAFLHIEVPCSCSVCLVEAITHKLDADELLSLVNL